MSIRILQGAFIVLASVGGIAVAEDATAQIQISGTIYPFISIAVPGSTNDWTFGIRDNTQTVTGVAVTSNAPWHIFVQTAKGIPDQGNDYYGHFWSPTAYAARLGARVNGHGPGFLENALVLNAGSGDVLLSDDPAPLTSGTSTGITQVPLSAKQTITMADPAANDYRVVVVFTASN